MERQDALAQLAALGRRVGRGAGWVVLLRGEAGVGKTALITGFLAGLDGSTPVLRGWCDPLAAPRPLGPLIDTLAGLGDAQSAGLAAAVQAGDIAAMYARLLAVLGSRRRWVWVIEDAHWADGATLDLLRFVARRIEALPVLLVVSYRDDELGDQHPLTVALGDIATCGALTRVDLAPLSRAAVATLAAGSGINADELHEVTGGNPFFVTEVLAAGADAMSGAMLPRSVSEAVWGRLARLSELARETAHAVAVCGPRTTTALLDSVCLAVPAGLDECLAAGMLRTDGQVVAFRHELARRASLDQIPDHQRRLLHKRALAALAEPPIDPDMLAALVFHADQAGDTDAVVHFGPAAADRAAALGAHSEATMLYVLVLRHGHTTPDHDKVVWFERHAFESYLCGQGDTAASSWRQAIDMRHQLGDRLEEGEDLRWLSHQLWPLGRNGEGLEAARTSLRLLEDLGPLAQLARSLMNMTHWAAVSYDPTCAGYAARTIALGTELGDPAVVIRARGYAALASIWSGGTGWDECDAAWREAMAVEGLIEEVGLLGSAMCWTAALHRDLDRAEGYIAETSAFCNARDFGTFQSMVIGAGALVALHRGDWGQATAWAEDVLTRPGLGPVHRMMALIALALTRARRGEHPVGSLLDEALENAEPDDFFRSGAVRAARAEEAWLAGDDDTARAEARAGLAVAPASADPWLVGALRRWAYATGHEPEITSERTLTPFDLEISGEWQAAVAAWIARGCPYDAAIAQLGGDVAAVESAVATFRKLGARAAGRRAQQRLAALRGRTPQGRRADTLADPHGLTRREREVFELLAGGHSDSQIAAALHISPKTVGCHVSSILAKLGVDNRIQAAARAAQHQVPPST